jgi:glycosyltransferase involved in cell wall biosynthesis
MPRTNEEQRLPRTLEELTAYLAAWGVDYRVLVANDGSTDRTATLTERRPRCSTLSLPENAGKGRAVRTAMLQATGRVLAFTDADLPFELRGLREGYQAICRGECEVVFGARDLPGSRLETPRSLSRRIATPFFQQLVKHLLRLEVTDPQCGLKLFCREAAVEIFSRATIDGFAFDTEVAAIVSALRLAQRRIPVTLVNDYSSSLSVSSSALPMLWDVVKLAFRQRSGRWRFRRQIPVDNLDLNRRAA